MMTTNVERLLENHEDDYGDVGWEVWFDRGVSDDPALVSGLGSVTVVDVFGGREGSGEYLHLVFKVIDSAGVATFYKKEGSYASFNGREWDGPFEQVTPVEKVYTDYVTV
jgi:hypothetical protein